MPLVHSRLDLNRWTAQFPLSLEQIAEKHTWASSHYIVGPESVAIVEQVRARFGGSTTMGPAAATDVLVWALGEPAERAATKVGGLPYRPAGHPWPTGYEGQPSAFVAQICFADSRDVLCTTRGKQLDLPGDVLLLFSPDKSGVWDGDDETPGSLQFEWWPLGLDRLATSTDVPVQPWTGTLSGTITPCHAHLHRSTDHPGLRPDHPIAAFEEPDRLCVFEGGKIGGIPFYIRNEEPRPGVFLGAIGSINPDGDTCPLLNVASRSDGDADELGNCLHFGDLGSLYLFWEPPTMLRRAGRLHWAIKGY